MIRRSGSWGRTATVSEVVQCRLPQVASCRVRLVPAATLSAVPVFGASYSCCESEECEARHAGLEPNVGYGKPPLTNQPRLRLWTTRVKGSMGQCQGEIEMSPFLAK